ncbi:hypothetical protein F4556_005177 [Kitasatospora gansuensis]|uniref:Uncharacterized protein n=1 Tax=Kitasatospora gansuensis TaxID=258050 RepID=A0A7W7SGG2_9ACTN|nr:hypothetical protein [Kitasatospora gansuensis]MBB4949642.1 hypothetical protein [Kitasatospora gansuensis]
MTVRSAWLLNPGQTREDTRLALAALTPTGSTTVRSGVDPGGTALLLTGTGMTGTIALGRATIQGTANQGAYPVVVTAAHSFTVANGHASLPRIDSVFIVAYDTAYDASGFTKPDIVIVQGTPNSSPVAPTSVPSCTAYLKLWDIRVEVNSSAGNPIDWPNKITDQRVYTVGVGGITPASDAIAGAYSGQYRDNAGVLERWSGSAWVPWPSALRGIAPASLVSGSYAGQWRDGAIGLERWSGSAWAKGLGEYQAYTPTWTASTTNPTLNNGTLAARYCRIGRQINYRGTLQLGSTSNGGAGTWFLSLPVAAASVGIYEIGSCDYTVLASNNFLGAVEIDPGGTTMVFPVKTGATTSSTANVSNVVPVNASAATRLSWNITYEAAT